MQGSKESYIILSTCASSPTQAISLDEQSINVQTSDYVVGDNNAQSWVFLAAD